jgi:hypothetical protein
VEGHVEVEGLMLLPGVLVPHQLFAAFTIEPGSTFISLRL